MGKLFVDEYPNVYEEICRLRECFTNLPNVMMRLESKIICDVLSVCYMRGWKVVSIHDSIVVIDTIENEGVQPIDIRKIINAVYRQYGLHPNTKVKANYIPSAA